MDTQNGSKLDDSPPEAQQLMLDSHKCRLPVPTPPTHQYYSGKHLSEIQINGTIYAQAEFKFE